MKRSIMLLAMAAPVAWIIGCNSAPEPAKNQAAGEPQQQAPVNPEIQAALAKLPEADRQLAQDQKFCAVLNDSPLGSMGTPVKILVEGQAVFLCCAGCQQKAQSNSKQTLANVQALKAANAGRTGP